MSAAQRVVDLLGLCCALGVACSPRAAHEANAPATPTRSAGAQSTLPAEKSGSGVPTSTAPAVASENPAPLAAPVALTSCAEVGPIACEAAPAPAAQLCSSAASCVVKRPDKSIGPIQELSCDLPSQTQPGVDGSGVRSVAIVNASGTTEEGRSSVAAYLVAERREGFCLVDELLPWAWPVGRYFKTDYELHWQQGDGTSLAVQAHRTTFIELDESEASAGESNIDQEECNRIVYRVLDGRFERSHEERLDGPCTPAKKTGKRAKGGSAGK